MLPSLLNVKECDSVTVLEEKMPSPGIEDGLTRRRLDLLCNLVTKILDDKLREDHIVSG